MHRMHTVHVFRDLPDLIYRMRSQVSSMRERIEEEIGAMKAVELPPDRADHLRGSDPGAGDSCLLAPQGSPGLGGTGSRGVRAEDGLVHIQRLHGRGEVLQRPDRR
jgi:hypothetical protein